MAATAVEETQSHEKKHSPSCPHCPGLRGPTVPGDVQARKGSLLVRMRQREPGTRQEACALHSMLPAA